MLRSHLKFMVVLVFVIFAIGVSKPVFAIFVPPTDITVTVYRLAFPGGGRHISNAQCNSTSTFFGCTAFDSDSGNYTLSQQRTYPYSTSSPTINIQSNYLLNVVPREITISVVNSVAVQAQSIASRTYAFWHISGNSNINNSTDFQVFVPLTFESLNTSSNPNNSANPCASTNLNSYQVKLCNAVAAKYYIAYNGDSPAFTEFFADIPNRTVVNGSIPYLRAVDDPISSYPTIVQDGHGRGMSSKGASRWAYGTLGFGGNLGNWSVKWDKVDRILFHYYTGVDLRYVYDTTTARVSSPKRWNPLKIENLPATISAGGSFSSVNVQLQNTGTSDWSCTGTNYYLTYRWLRPGVSSSSYTQLGTNLCGTVKGDPSVTLSNLTISVPNWGNGSYVLYFDIKEVNNGNAVYFGDPPNNWPPYRVAYTIGTPSAYRQMLPVINQNCNGTCSIPSH